MSDDIAPGLPDDRRWTLIIPCAAPLRQGAPSRPKWLLTTPLGDLVIACAAATVPRDRVERIIVAFLREAEERYKCTEALKRAFDGDVECIVLDQETDGPAHTAYEAIGRAGVLGPVCIKDSDSFFSISQLPTSSFMAVADIRSMPSVSAPGRKSYVRLNEQGMIVEVTEKNVTSNLISVGLYGFDDAGLFAAEFERLVGITGGRHLFVSHVVASTLAHSHIFMPCFAQDLVDIGTLADWNKYRASYPTVLLDIDGVIFRNQSKFFDPVWSTPPEPIEDNVAHLLMLQRRGAQLVFMTARPEEYRAITVAQLEILGLKVHALVMGCNHSTRFLVNDYARSNPYPSAIAVNVRRNANELRNLLLPDLPTQDQGL